MTGFENGHVFKFDEGTPRMAPGQFGFATNQAGELAYFVFGCPCGDPMHTAALSIDRVNHPNSHIWKWNGNQTKPSLRPSIQRMTGCKWHGWMVQGVMRTDRGPTDEEWADAS